MKEFSASAVAADGDESDDLLYKFLLQITLTAELETRWNDRREADFAGLLHSSCQISHSPGKAFSMINRPLESALEALVSMRESNR